jgi:Gnt-I system low-affinity gluconate transporter
MDPLNIFLIILAGVAILFTLVFQFKISAFISLLITSIAVGILTGMPLTDIAVSIEKGMGGTLGFVAIVVGLGAIFGQILESSGGAQSLAHYLIRKFGIEKSSWAMMITGFIVAIPIFFDVGLIILIPIVYALSRNTRKSLLYYGIPLLAGLAVTHSFIPPTPGPVAVAKILDSDLGRVILFGFILGIPTAIISGHVWGNFISKKIHVSPPEEIVFNDTESFENNKNVPSFGLIIGLIMIPLVLIISSTVVSFLIGAGTLKESFYSRLLVFTGHPFTALIIVTLISIYLLGYRKGMPKQKMLELSSRALGPAGIIILITGAGGVLKQILVDSGMGKTMAESIALSSFPPVLLAWILAAVVRIIQGSATVAMITAAGIISPVLHVLELNPSETALIVISIASGATILSHVNDSGFWLVSKYFYMDEKQTLKSWTAMETILAVCGLVFCLLADLLV